MKLMIKSKLFYKDKLKSPNPSVISSKSNRLKKSISTIFGKHEFNDGSSSDRSSVDRYDKHRISYKPVSSENTHIGISPWDPLCIPSDPFAASSNVSKLNKRSFLADNVRRGTRGECNEHNKENGMIDTLNRNQNLVKQSSMVNFRQFKSVQSEFQEISNKPTTTIPMEHLKQPLHKLPSIDDISLPELTETG